MTTTLPVIEDRIRPFYCGSQAADWQESNCNRCTKNTPSELGMPTCPIQRAVFEAYISDGTVSAEIAVRMGIDDDLAYLWQCGEVEWTPEWIAEHRRQRTYRFARWRFNSRRRISKWVSEFVRNLRMKWRMPIAERRGMTSPDTCWAAWCSWAIGGGEKPEGCGGGERCRDESKENRSCWCGKFCDGKVSGGKEAMT